MGKSTIFFGSVDAGEKQRILDILPFKIGKLSINIPLLSKKVGINNCYNEVKEINSLLKDFLWNQGKCWNGKAKVAWSLVCCPKSERGLGLKLLDKWNEVRVITLGDGFETSMWHDNWHVVGPLSKFINSRSLYDARLSNACTVKDMVKENRLELFNKALMVTHIWNLLLKKDSLWVKWIHEYKLRGRHFFKVPYSGNMTRGWRKFLQLRPLIRDHVRYHLGDGATCSLWFDRWSPCGPLVDIISSRDIHRAGFNLSSKVWDSLKELAGLSNVEDSITVIVDSIIPFAKRRSIRSVIAKLVVAACSYFVWQERNFRLFKSQKRMVIDCIKSSVRLKLLSCTFKNSKDALVFQRLWDLPDSIFR
ncbi:hypothetical protein Tco_1283892 [Tanacetum coccineum]